MTDERRRPRQSFTRALKKIAERIDAQDVYTIDYYNDLLRQSERTVFRVNALWAFGSWAKGALECGDLDLMADISLIEGYMPFDSVICRVLIKRARDVRLYIGTPEKNSSRAILKDAVLIWSPGNRDWKANINDIKPDPTVKRYKRPTDVLPLRNEQLYTELEELENLIAQRKQGVLTWDWHPFQASAPCSDRWSPDGKSLLDRVSHRRTGKKICAALALVIDWFEKNGPVQTWRWDDDSRAAFWVNGIRTHIGRPTVYHGWLDHHSCSGMMLVPHLSSRGPNGIWHIRRGKKHPLERLFRGIQAFTTARPNGKPLPVRIQDGWRTTDAIDFFRGSEDAESFFKEFHADESEAIEDGIQVTMVAGTDLLAAISQVDQIFIDGDPYAINQNGRWMDGEEIPLPEPKALANHFAMVG